MTDMTSNIATLKTELTQMVEQATDLAALDAARVAALGKNGRITALMKNLGTMTPDERKETGAALNVLKDEIADLIARQDAALKKQAMDQKLAAETIDITLSPRPERKGHIHPISQTMDEIAAIFADMGFVINEGPDIEDDFHNFTALNFPPGHPAREMHDTFYLPDDPDAAGEAAKKLLRTHTSTVQVRTMMKQKPPIRMIVMGRTYRSDYDMTHTPMFHQCEGLVIDKSINMGHLKGCLLDFVRAYFNIDDLPLRFRPSFFPFTEPSAEVDIGCSRKDGGLKIGAGDSWLEIGGCGMVHPNVLKNCGIDPDEYQGFAFGMGIERMAMLKYGIPDLRTFFESDVRWLEHYGFDPLNRPNRATD
ncbi:phenylalanine--tRNA ligase subunit alpha [Micavibrio aeruginosavorus]|uniref:Phenylalanine--tRNA ligase alpha subunit n=1 Tax=Micavibrio aeruginosavorus EPB TaxID=349215 RepID=M4VHZ5_9BACT|nr:phenylalanine--tRNA ligase subunit alpha [Micavibrio aeruginosavorus]AGH98987.1 Phenylalanyl-tRNA synthetase alpha chain [Micavibrio aeruginosavorus EPB]